VFDRFMSTAARRLAVGACVAATLSAAAPALRAEGEAAAPPLDELVARALANAPSIAARRARLAAAQAALPTADVLPDPTVEFEWRDGGFPTWTLGSDPMSMIGGTIRQTLISGGRKNTRRASAAAAVDVRHAEVDATACDLTMAVRTEYSRLYAIDQERSILRDAEEMARLLADTALSRYASGSSDQSAVRRAQLERTLLSERATDLDAERAKSVATLNRLLNLPADTPFGEVRSLPDLPVLTAPMASLPAEAANVAPEVAVRKADVVAAEKRVEVARAELKPTWTIGGSFFWQGNTDRVVAFTVGMEWPARKDRRQGPMVTASERELEAARFDLEDTAAGMRAEAARLVAEITRTDAQIVRYRSGLLPQSSAALEAANASYLGGRGEFASVLDEFRRWTEIRVELARREASRFTAQGQLDVLVNPADHGAWEHHAPANARDPKKEPRS
jgi:outer membrane protein, heavy metal efflux system